MIKAPWYVMNHLLCLQYRIPKVSTTELDFDLNPFWIQVHNLPLENLNRQNITTILQRVGKIVDMEEPIVEGRIVRHLIRARDLIDVTKPLHVGC